MRAARAHAHLVLQANYFDRVHSLQQEVGAALIDCCCSKRLSARCVVRLPLSEATTAAANMVNLHVKLPGHLMVLQCNAVQGALPGETAGALVQLAQMFGLNTFHKQLGDFLEDGYMSGAPLD